MFMLFNKSVLIALVFLLACSSITNNSRSNQTISIVHGTEVKFQSINGTMLNPDSTKAVVVAHGQNQIVFRWPSSAIDFKIPATYLVTFYAIGGKEYEITTNHSSPVPCIFEKAHDKQEGINRSALACATRHKSNSVEF